MKRLQNLMFCKRTQHSNLSRRTGLNRTFSVVCAKASFGPGSSA
jgi:hypothetical protein